MSSGGFRNQGQPKRTSSRLVEGAQPAHTPSPAPAQAPIKKVGRGFGHGQPQPTDRAPHKLGRPGVSRQKGAGRTQRASKPRGPPTPEKLETKRGQALLHDPEAAGGGLAWAEYYAAKAGVSQKTMAKQMGIDRRSLCATVCRGPARSDRRIRCCSRGS